MSETTQIEQIKCCHVNAKTGKKCNSRLFDNYNNGKIDNVVIKCQKCGNFNVIKR